MQPSNHSGTGRAETSQCKLMCCLGSISECLPLTAVTLPINQVATQVGNSPAIIEKYYFKRIPSDDDREILRQQLQEAVR